jgi:hypothetical protein
VDFDEAGPSVVVGDGHDTAIGALSGGPVEVVAAARAAYPA